jgi:hypothetical protein
VIDGYAALFEQLADVCLATANAASDADAYHSDSCSMIYSTDSGMRKWRMFSGVCRR